MAEKKVQKERKTLLILTNTHTLTHTLGCSAFHGKYLLEATFMYKIISIMYLTVVLVI